MSAEQEGQVVSSEEQAVMDFYRSVVEVVTEFNYDSVEPHVDPSERKAIQAQRTTIVDGEWHWGKRNSRLGGLVLGFYPGRSEYEWTGEVSLEIISDRAKYLGAYGGDYLKIEDVLPLWSKRFTANMPREERERGLIDLKDALTSSWSEV